MATGMDLIDRIREERSDPPSGIHTLGLGGTHRWITELEAGRVVFAWPFDDRYLNLEGAVICSWTSAVADQALFFAGTSLCADGEVTRMADLRLTCIHNITDGPVTVEARITERTEDRMYGSVSFTLPDGRLAATVAATIDVVS